jgi:hypothetical protein
MIGLTPPLLLALRLLRRRIREAHSLASACR